MAKINVLYIHEFSKISGAENSLLELVRFIDRSRFEPIFILPESGAMVGELKKINVEVHLISLPKIRRCFGVFAAVRKIKSVIRGRDIKIIHSNSIRSHLYGFFASFRAGIALVWHQRNMLISERFDTDRILSYIPDAIICNSNAVARRFSKSGKNLKKVTVVYSGVDLERFNPRINGDKIKKEFSIDADRLVVGIIGRLDLRKGHEYFFRAAQIITKSFQANNEKKPIFLVVGDSLFSRENRNKQMLADLAKELGIPERIIFTDFRTDMPLVFAGLDIVVSASLFEACSRVILEAMASAKAVIATNVGGSSELIDDGLTGVLVPERNYESIAKAAIDLLNDAKKRLEMGRNARRKAEELFDIRASVRRIEDIYENLLKKYK